MKLDLRKLLLFYTEGAEALGQAVHGGCGCPILGNIQGQLGAGLRATRSGGRLLRLEHNDL